MCIGYWVFGVSNLWIVVLSLGVLDDYIIMSFLISIGQNKLLIGFEIRSAQQSAMSEEMRYGMTFYLL